MRHIVQVLSASSLVLFGTACGGGTSSAFANGTGGALHAATQELAIGDTVYVTDGDPLPEAPEGTEWVATGLVIETHPVMVEYVLQAISEPQPEPHPEPEPEESPSQLTAMVGTLLPDPPPGKVYVLTALLETFPAQYQFELQPGEYTFDTFAALFNIIGAFAEGPVSDWDIQFLLDLALNDGVLEGHERQALHDATWVLDSVMSPEAKALLQDFLKNH